MSETLGFERERLRYCEAMYALEKERKQIIERQAQFFFGIITLFLGLLALKGEVLETIRTSITQQSTSIASVLYFEILLFLMAFAASLLTIAMVFAPERRHKPYPTSLVTQLYSPSAGSRKQEEHQVRSGAELEADFLRENALRLAVAVERNSRGNTRKSKWLVAAATSCLAAILSYAILATTILFLSL